MKQADFTWGPVTTYITWPKDTHLELIKVRGVELLMVWAFK